MKSGGPTKKNSKLTDKYIDGKDRHTSKVCVRMCVCACVCVCVCVCVSRSMYVCIP